MLGKNWAGSFDRRYELSIWHSERVGDFRYALRALVFYPTAAADIFPRVRISLLLNRISLFVGVFSLLVQVKNCSKTSAVRWFLDF